MHKVNLTFSAQRPYAKMPPQTVYQRLGNLVGDTVNASARCKAAATARRSGRTKLGSVEESTVEVEVLTGG